MRLRAGAAVPCATGLERHGRAGVRGGRCVRRRVGRARGGGRVARAGGWERRRSAAPVCGCCRVAGLRRVRERCGVARAGAEVRCKAKDAAQKKPLRARRRMRRRACVVVHCGGMRTGTSP
jgi:hypothetical protein